MPSIHAGSKVVHGNGGRWIQLWSSEQFQDEFNHAIDNNVFVGVSNGDAASAAGSECQMTARIVQHNRIDVFMDSLISNGNNVRINYLIALF